MDYLAGSCLARERGSSAVCLLVGWLLNVPVNLRDGSAQTVVHAATLR